MFICTQLYGFIHNLTNIDHPFRFTTSQILNICRILKAYGKKPTGDITICWFYQGLQFHTLREDGTNPTSIRPTKRNRSSNNDSLQKHQSESTFTRWRHRILRHCSRSTTRGHASPYLFIICLDYVLRTSIDKIRENGFELTKKRSRRYPAKTITDADYTDDIALLTNTPNQAETLLHSLEWTAVELASMLMHTDLNTCALIKQATSPY